MKSNPGCGPGNRTTGEPKHQKPVRAELCPSSGGTSRTELAAYFKHAEEHLRADIRGARRCRGRRECARPIRLSWCPLRWLRRGRLRRLRTRRRRPFRKDRNCRHRHGPRDQDRLHHVSHSRLARSAVRTAREMERPGVELDVAWRAGSRAIAVAISRFVKASGEPAARQARCGIYLWV